MEKEPGSEFQNQNTRLCYTQVYNTKYLGLVIDESFNWENCVDLVRGKIAQALGIMYRIKFYVNYSTYKNSLISFQCTVTCDIELLPVGSKYNLKKLVCLQNEVVSLIWE